ncbi:MAG: asparagine synthase-related protein [Alphaproteobacteria bacterium]|nr:asparagine synthase-related protein [Alphaproteobacteria bacterium]
MAGIAGYFGQAREPEVLQGMVRKLAHRGRGGEAFYLANPVFMGIRGTAADSTAQPAYSHDDSIVVLFSGDISNYGALRDDLTRKGIHFRGDGVAELILHLYEAYGLNLASHLRGRFVFAVHDTLKDFVFLSRDRLGQEPLYYMTTQSGTFVFASEIKALLEHPGVQVAPDMRGIDAYLTLGYSPGPDSFFKGVHKLPAGHRLIWNPGLHVMIEPYWQWETYMRADTALKSGEDFQARFNMLLEDAIGQSAAGFSKPGVSLSGVVEETAIAAFLMKDAPRGLDTFTVGYDDGDAAFAPAREIARKLGTRHSEVICTPPDMEKLPEIVWALDEPVADPSVLSSFMLAQLAGQSTDGLLRGTGAEDMMCGLVQQEAFLQLNRMPAFMAGFYRLGIKMLPQAWMNSQFDYNGQVGDKCRERLSMFLAEVRKGSSMARRYGLMTSIFSARDKSAMYGDSLSPVMESFIDARKDAPGWPTQISAMLALQKDYVLQDSTLLRADKIAALASTVHRHPYLDHPLVEFILGAPDNLKYQSGRGKVMIRRYVESVAPGLPEISRRNATLPLHRFMSTRVMRDMIETCLSEKSVASRGLFKPAAVRDAMTYARDGDTIGMRQIFALMMLELWFRVYIDHEKGWAR